MRTLLISIALLLTVCESKGNENINMMMEMVHDPMEGVAVSESMRKSMGAEGVIIKYKKCMTNMSKDIFEGMKGEVQESEDLGSVTKLSTCPTPYTALCESKTGKTYYYTDAKRILDGAKEECRYYIGKWTASTQGKEVVAKTYKATFQVNGTPYTYESVNNCMIHPMDKDTILTPQFGDNDTWVKLNATTKKGEQGCMFDLNTKGKHYHAEKCTINYDGKTLTGKTTATNIHKHDDSVEITFDIVCK